MLNVFMICFTMVLFQVLPSGAPLHHKLKQKMLRLTLPEDQTHREVVSE